jgi:hypothetical protein
LEDTVLLDTRAQGSQFVLVEALARLEWVRLNLVHGDFTGGFGRQFSESGVRTTDQGVEAASETPFFHFRTPQSSESVQKGDSIEK